MWTVQCIENSKLLDLYCSETQARRLEGKTYELKKKLKKEMGEKARQNKTNNYRVKLNAKYLDAIYNDRDIYKNRGIPSRARTWFGNLTYER